MELKNAEYFHIHKLGKDDNEWIEGNSLSFFSGEKNYFNQYYDHVGFYTDLLTGKPELLLASLKSYNQLTQEQKLGVLDRYLGRFIEVASELGKFSREIIFEEIRNNFFPHLPSRRSCIWLCKKDAIGYWEKEIGNESVIVKLNVTGRCHFADQRHLVSDLYSHNDLRRFAFNYWTGHEDENSEEVEILFEGIVNVIQVYKNLVEFNEQNSE